MDTLITKSIEYFYTMQKKQKTFSSFVTPFSSKEYCGNEDLSLNNFMHTFMFICRNHFLCLFYICIFAFAFFYIMKLISNTLLNYNTDQ